MRKEFTHSDKSELRHKLMLVRNNLEDKHTMSERATASLLPLLHGSVMAYVSIGSELNTHALIKQLLRCDDIVLYAPYTKDGEITARRIVNVKQADKWGNMPEDCYLPLHCGESSDNKPIKLDYCVTPLIGFNDNGHRIGYGKGCYDKFFARNDCVCKIGLAFSCQRVEFTPDTNDIALDCCVTERNVIYF